MKKAFVFYLLMIFAGLGLVIAAFSMGFEWNDALDFMTDESNYQKMDTVLIDEGIKTLVVDVDTSSIIISPSNSNQMTIDYYQYKDTVKLENSGEILSITQREKFQWFSYKIPSFDKRDVYITVPLSWNLKVKVDSQVGSIKIGSLTFENLSIYSSTGSIWVNEVTSPKANIKNQTGSIRFINNQIDEIELTTATGSINVDASTFEKINLESQTGSIYMEGSYQTYSLNLKTTTGSIYIDGNKKSKDYSEDKATTLITAHTQTGSIRINNK